MNCKHLETTLRETHPSNQFANYRPIISSLELDTVCKQICARLLQRDSHMPVERVQQQHGNANVRRHVD